MGLQPIRATTRRIGLVSGLAFAAVLAASFCTTSVQARTPSSSLLPGSAVASVSLTGLPVQGQEVMEQIRQGGPFRFEKDGTVFGNYERQLPRQRRGYYREYTVPTPGLSHRGASGSCAVASAPGRRTPVITPRTTTPASG